MVKKTNIFFGIAWLWCLCFLLVLIPPCQANKDLQIPELLAPWVDWVLYDKKQQLECTPHYNAADHYLCAWPSKLELMLTDTGGNFTQSWLVNSESWISLPGNDTQWPQDVRVDKELGIVIQKNHRPQVLLQPGTHEVTGRFTWPALPENLDISPESGLVSLVVNGQRVLFPNMDAAGRLWLKATQTREVLENRLKIESFRLITDSIPCEVLLYFTLDVSGSAREIMLGPLYAPEKFMPLSLDSPLPARLEQDGRMRMQVRPGQYHIRLNLRHTGVVNELVFDPPGAGAWPGEEIWSFNANPHLRLVEIEGVPPVDPLGTAMPRDWQAYPAYKLVAGESMQLNQIKRGDPHPAPDLLALDRNIWLRFDGSGYTLQDAITGNKNSNWRLEIDPVLALGRVSVDGTEQLITRQKGTDRAGVELRNGVLNLVAHSIYQGRISVLPAIGWDHDFQQVQGHLHLPPGWKLLNAAGMDTISRTWIKQWTLLDFFIVLIFTISLGKLFSKPLAGVGFLTLVLIYHEPLAPRYIWLALLIGFALLFYLPDGKFKKAVKIYQGIVIFCLVSIVIPYAIQALRIGMYPQLAAPWTSMAEYGASRHSPLALEADDVRELAREQMASPSVVKLGKALEKNETPGPMAQISGAAASYYGSQVMEQDPKSRVQTGPGMPQWLPFETIDFGWSGPVTRDQTLSFFLVGPKINLVLAFVRVFLIFILALGMVGVRYRPGDKIRFTGLKSLKIFAICMMFLMSPLSAQSSEIPSREMLDTLQERLLETDTCFPRCADISDAYITIDQDRLSIQANIDAKIPTAIPIPSHVKHWLPDQVMIDGIPCPGLLRKDSNLWAQVPEGKHILTLGGPIPRQTYLQLYFPLKPHRVSIKAVGWSVEGGHPDGKIDGQLQFKRVGEPDNALHQVLETGILPPFVSVERRIRLGLVWKIQTKIHRLGPTGSGIVLDIPLIPGESITTQGIQVTKGVAKINLGSDQTDLGWESFLEPADQIRLTHAPTTTWTEIWKLDVSPIFHLTYEGIPVIAHKSGTLWYPTWHPWPGEAVTLNITRPGGIEGQTLTIEKSLLELRPGRKTTAAQMALSIKSSQGGHHTLTLPATASLQEVMIMGRVVPVRQDGLHVALPITPGQQEVVLKWVESRGMTSLYQSSNLDLGAPSANASVDLY
ncbi:MAG: hypothetical protein KKC20_23410, partial [Proteobacteria bacterium]|nr:hypothetical protein [Pseudomonadota bacterium]